MLRRWLKSLLQAIYKSALLFLQSNQNKTSYTGETPVNPVWRQNVWAHTVRCSEHSYTVLHDARANLYPYRSELQSQICLKNQRNLWKTMPRTYFKGISDCLCSAQCTAAFPGLGQKAARTLQTKVVLHVTKIILYYHTAKNFNTANMKSQSLANCNYFD